MRRRGLAIGTLSVAGAVLAGGGTALAQGGDNGSQHCERRLERIAERRGITVAALAAVRTMLRAAAGYLGVPSEELRAELRSGKSLEAVAEARARAWPVSRT